MRSPVLAQLQDAQISSAMKYQGVSTSNAANQELGTSFSTGSSATAASGGGGGTGVAGRYFDPTHYSADPNDFMGEGKFGAGALDKGKKGWIH